MPSICCMLCRVIRRMAVPSAIGTALPKDTIHYGCKVLRATVAPTGDACHWRLVVPPVQQLESVPKIAACLCCGGSYVSSVSEVHRQRGSVACIWVCTQSYTGSGMAQRDKQHFSEMRWPSLPS